MKPLIIKSLGGFVTETAEIAVIPIAETILESMILEKVVNSVSKKAGTPIVSISFSGFLVNKKLFPYFCKNAIRLKAD